MGVEVDIELPTLKELQDAFKSLPNNIAAKHMAAALGRAIDPTYKLIRQLTPRGPTGNLKKAVKKKTKRYVRDGAGVAVAGYTKPPRGKIDSDRKSNERGFHAHFVEKGTKDRKTKGRVASSYNSRLPFEVVRRRNGALVTKPRRPKAFLKTASLGEQVDLGRMPVGGRKGVPPIETAYARQKSQIKTDTIKEMAEGILKATKEMARPFRGGKAQ
jgi:hypothetical protein